ncbi:MAG TPA: rhodanese-like domain-containing protein [Anaeromyxobacteraceae bacterium]|nr:rhodanese-like domain-containing protein [Anaeromyxobacteraceae bacterium]
MPVRRVGPVEASHLLAQGTVDLVDVREPHEWLVGHLPGARHVPLGLFLHSPGRHLRGARAIFVCAHGIRSVTAAAVAERNGCAEAYSLDGGVLAWLRAGFPLERG